MTPGLAAGRKPHMPAEDLNGALLPTAGKDAGDEFSMEIEKDCALGVTTGAVHNAYESRLRDGGT